MAITVLPSMSVWKFSWIAASTSESNAEVASSSTRIGAFFKRTRDSDPLALASGQFDPALADERVVALSPVEIGQAHHKIVRVRLPRRGDHRFVGRIGPAVTNVLADRAVQQRRILRDHADLLAQALLRRQRDVLPVNQDAPALDVVEAQHEIDQRRLAGAGTPDQTDLFARLDRQREVVDHAASLAVVEPDVLEPDGALGSVKRAGVGAIDQRARARDRSHPFLDLSDIVEDADRGPHYPARHEGDAEREPGRNSDVAQRHSASRPEPDCKDANADQQDAVADRNGQIQEGDQSGLATKRRRVIDQRIAGLFVLALEVSEQLNCLDVV
jgi:hypothetical protein